LTIYFVIYLFLTFDMVYNSLLEISDFIFQGR
jgi:hypothetical protein